MTAKKTNKHNELKLALKKSGEFMALQHLKYKTENNILVNLNTKNQKLIDLQLDKVMTARRHLRWATDIFQEAKNRLRAYERRMK